MKTPFPSSTVKIGVIVGAGTGRRLANIFKEFLDGLVRFYLNQTVLFLEGDNLKDLPYQYHSYKTIVEAVESDVSKYNTISQEEVGRLLDTTQNWFREGVRTIFRTSINAEALYLFRQEVGAIKEFGLETNSGGKILFVRDQAEGFYANKQYRIIAGEEEIYFSGTFSKKHQKKIAEHAFASAKAFMENREFQTWAIYKHHLFGDVIHKWLKEVDPGIQAFQPDTGLTKLNSIISDEKKANNGSSSHNILIICSNEVGDIIYETILGVVNIEAELELYTRNIYTAEPFSGEMLEYQTVHGSADDIEGTEKILPYATLRIAADIAEKRFGIKDIKNELEYAISEAKRKRLLETTPILQHVYRHFQIKPVL